MKRSILLMLLALPIANSIRAQSVGPATVNSAGGSAVIGSNQFDWSAGEMTMVSTFSTSGIIVTQGVLQPFDGTTKVVNTALLQQLQVFPNPASSTVNLQYASQAGGTLSYRLMDMAGRVITRKTVDIKQGTTTEQLDISALANASYMLEVSVNSTNAAPEIVSYKIQKIK